MENKNNGKQPGVANPAAHPGNFQAGGYYRIKNHSQRTLVLCVNPARADQLVRLPPDKVITLDGRQINSNALLADQLAGLKATRQITVQDLKIEANREYVVNNQTPRRIGIRALEAMDDLILPPFGSRVISSDILNGYDYLPWTWQSLVKINPLVKTRKNHTVLMWRFLMMLFFILFLMVSLPLAIIERQPLIWNITGVVSMVFILSFTILHYLVESRNELDNFFDQIEDFVHFFPGIALVLLIGVGLPVIAYNQQITMQTYLPNLANLEALGRFMQVMFISIASILPALLYYLFGRMQMNKQRDGFFREALVLDPHVESFAEAESKYAPLLESVFGTGSTPFSVLLLVISTALLVMGWMIALPPSPITLTPTSTMLAFFQLNPDYFVFGFLGAYFFAINMIFRRYVRADLNPKTYAYITVRLLITIILVWVIQTLPQFNSEMHTPLLNSSLYALSFLIGIFPDWGLAMIKDATRGITKNIKQDDNDGSMPLSDLEGMNLYDRARLLEEGIENIENLAHHDLMELIARTRIPTGRLVDMFDQSILYLHLGMYDEANDGDSHATSTYNGPALLSKLKSFGVRTASGLINMLEADKAGRNNSRFKAEFSEDEANRLVLIAEAIKGEEWLPCIQNWAEFNHIAQPICDPYRFYYRAAAPQEVAVQEVPEAVQEVAVQEVPGAPQIVAAKAVYPMKKRRAALQVAAAAQMVPEAAQIVPEATQIVTKMAEGQAG